MTLHQSTFLQAGVAVRRGKKQNQGFCEIDFAKKCSMLSCQHFLEDSDKSG